MVAADQLAREIGLDERDTRKSSSCRVAVERGGRAEECYIPETPDVRRRQGSVMAPRHVPGGETIPDGWQGAHHLRAVYPICLARERDDPIGKRRCHDGGEIPVENRPLRRNTAEERQIVGDVITDCMPVVALYAEPSIALAVVVGNPAARVRMRELGEAAAVELREPVRRMGNTISIGVAETRLFSIGPGEPAEEMIERPALHRDHNDVVE